MPGSFSTVLAHMEPPSSRKQAKRVRLGPKRTLLGAPDVLGEPRGADLVPTTPDWPAWVGFMVTTHFDLVSGPFHSPIFIGLHSVSTSDNMYHLHSRAGELPRSASSHFDIQNLMFNQVLQELNTYDKIGKYPIKIFDTR